jgi:hypothetical protein
MPGSVRWTKEGYRQQAQTSFAPWLYSFDVSRAIHRVSSRVDKLNLGAKAQSETAAQADHTWYGAQ